MSIGNFTLAQKSMDAIWLKQKVISSNLANLDTPGYKSKSVEFSDLLKDILDNPGSSLDSLQNKLDALEPKVIENDSTEMREDGNNVDADVENIELARAQLQYEYMIRSVSSEISRLKYVINGG